jgi:hypothetical protein
MRGIRCSLLLLAFGACSQAPAPAGFPVQPTLVMSSKSALFSIAVRTAPSPPTRGDQSVEYTITDASTGKVVPGLTLDVVPWMPIMDHGTSIVPSVTETTPGTYLVSNVDLFMAGEWALRTTISGPAGDAGAPDAGVESDYVSPVFQIP